MFYDVQNAFDGTPLPFHCFGEVLADEQCEVMQYISLKDKNGKEIYEGDIVKYLDEIDGVTELIGFVEWERCWWSVNLHPRYLRENDIMDTEEYINYEVIGNIFENPELL